MRGNRGLAAGGELAARRASEDARFAAGDGAHGGDGSARCKLLSRGFSNGRQLEYGALHFVGRAARIAVQRAFVGGARSRQPKWRFRSPRAFAGRAWLFFVAQ
jgi:hypothetical protein